MKPFLLLSHRTVDRAADGEHESFLRFCGLDEHELRRIRMERESIAGLDLDAWSGILLGGGPYNVSDAVKSATQQRVEAELAALMDEVVARDVPLLGACYGIGVVGSHQGAVVDRTYGEPVGATTITLTEAGRADPLFGGLPTTFDAFVGHKEAITRLPDHLVALASSPACPVHAFRVGANVYATQFHPELDAPALATRIEVYANAGYFDPSEVAALQAAAHAAVVTHPPTLLRRFVELHAR